MENIYLVGFMGTGKSAAGRLAATQLGWKFVDLDALIEHAQGCAIAAIFSRKGEEHFRGLEHAALAQVAEGSRQVVACGGGIVIKPENIALMKRTGVMVCLNASPEVIMARTAGTGQRPLLNVPDPRQRIAELLAQRAPLYAQADVQIDTSHFSLVEVAAQIATVPLR